MNSGAAWRGSLRWVRRLAQVVLIAVTGVGGIAASYALGIVLLEATDPPAVLVGTLAAAVGIGISTLAATRMRRIRHVRASWEPADARVVSVGELVDTSSRPIHEDDPGQFRHEFDYEVEFAGKRHTLTYHRWIQATPFKRFRERLRRQVEQERELYLTRGTVQVFFNPLDQSEFTTDRPDPRPAAAMTLSGIGLAATGIMLATGVSSAAALTLPVALGLGGFILALVFANARTVGEVHRW
jgi:ABC-type multidrug transport system fused ATPase/permease subunit